MKELDLHGYSHLEVQDKIENFVTSNPTPFRIITGNSEMMKKLTEEVLTKYHCVFYTPAHNPGEIIAID